MKAHLEASKDITRELESKVESAEAELLQHHKKSKQRREELDKRDDEIKALKN